MGKMMHGFYSETALRELSCSGLMTMHVQVRRSDGTKVLAWYDTREAADSGYLWHDAVYVGLFDASEFETIRTSPDGVGDEFSAEHCRKMIDFIRDLDQRTPPQRKPGPIPVLRKQRDQGNS
jgi:hypothetical protein